ncbi:MAG: Fic family protein [Terrimonas ferruginea]|uniref:Fic family protein n=1 Tax=Terrimonas ferruginea TaxID=249 RepID=UPI00086D95DC|nr:Fic family protein [Terrimonas ferruginea]MBN8781427.1 Fic family protein [Terrimonas ferruginea]ODS91521.1 MAG: cell filamentation protein Fic [Chryseobacterium sp. SCN 40-13]OJW42341.1 MAG: cell filamentation protein Fic [Sphingobacteriales bacterium 48-107]
MAKYNWQQKDWPHFKFSLTGVEGELLIFSEKVGRVSGILEALPEETKQDVIVDIILAEAIKTSEIEGEFPSRKDVLSSIRKNLGLHHSPEHIKDKSAAGLGELMIDVRMSFKEKLTEEKLFAWHRMLLQENKRIEVGQWRTHEEPMQVISGAMGKEKVHYEAPPSSEVPGEMRRFIKWFNETGPGGKEEIKNAPVRSGIAHLYFETIHPFEDGNGRIGRAIAEKALSQTIGRPVMLSLSRTIEAKKSDYYESLEKAQRSNEITPWIEYFIKTTLDAQIEAEAHIDFTLKTTRFFDRYKDHLNDRQLTVVRRMLEEGPKGFKGGMNARKYIGITKTSKATATRDMQQLLEIGAFILSGKAGGRSTSYQVNI